MKHHQIPITVGLPVYNSEDFLKECIDSILSQSFSDFELLIIDDESTDDSLEIINSYTDSRIRLICARHDYINTINLLFTEARGKYFARMDDDDVMLPDRLKTQYEYMESHPEVDILGGGMQYFGASTGTYVPYHESRMEIGMFAHGCCMANSTVMFRMSSILKAGLSYKREFIYAEDYHLWVQALEAGLVMYNVKDILTKYRFSNSQISHIYSREQSMAAEKVKKEIMRFIISAEQQWALPEPYQIPETSKKLTVIIPFLNERDEVEHTVSAIRKTVGEAVDIIVINDASYDNYPYGERLSPYKTYYVVNQKRMGVAASRDFGIKLCKTPYFLLLDAHMRFYDGRWADRITEELSVNGRQLLCCQTKFLHKDQETGEVEVAKECPMAFGAYSPFGQSSVWPDIEWNTREVAPQEDKEEIAVVLGAGYASSRNYWLHLRGLEGLHHYGSDEAYISNKVFLEGGKCVLLKNIVIGHIYRSVSPYGILSTDSVYNQLLVSFLTFPEKVFCQSLSNAICQDRAMVRQIFERFKRDKERIWELHAYYRRIFRQPFGALLKKNLQYKPYDKEQMNRCLSALPEIYGLLSTRTFHECGLFDGSAGAALWICHYAEYANEPLFEERACVLWEETENRVMQKQMPWGFKHGVSGVGWCAMYLWSNKMLETFPDMLLKEIDEQLQLLDPYMCNDYTFETGLAGVLAYLCYREPVAGTYWGTPLLGKWFWIALKILQKSEDRRAIYYASYFVFRYKYGDNSNYKDISISTWINTTIFIPQNNQYWSLSLENGVLASSLTAMLINKPYK